MDVAFSSVHSCPCQGYGVQIHPAWAAFYEHIQTHPFRTAAEAEAWWRFNDCPTDHSGRLILPPEEIPCPCGAVSAVAA